MLVSLRPLLLQITVKTHKSLHLICSYLSIYLSKQQRNGATQAAAGHILKSRYLRIYFEPYWMLDTNQGKNKASFKVKKKKNIWRANSIILVYILKWSWLSTLEYRAKTTHLWMNFELYWHCSIRRFCLVLQYS